MKNQIQTLGIVLTRTDFQEADRILTIITPNFGKQRVIAKGVRRQKSKLAGGIELFSVSEISILRGRGELGTLVSTRLKKHYGKIVADINRTMLGYDLIKLLNKATEDEPEEDYFNLLVTLFESLNDFSLSQDIIMLWFYSQIMRLSGHSPNLHTAVDGQPLQPGSTYMFDYESMSLVQHPEGSIKADHIKFLRIVFNGNTPATLQKITGAEGLAPQLLQIIKTALPNHIRT